MNITSQSLSQPVKPGPKRTARVWQISLELLQKTVQTSSSYAEVQRKLGFTGSGAGYQSTRRRIALEQINTDHFRVSKGIPPEHLPLTLEQVFSQVLIPNSPYHQCTVRKYIKKYNILPYTCVKCTLQPWWNNEPLTLQLDHQDGDNRNHTLTNLRWLCPNCHTQTKNFSVLNHKRTIPICLRCGVQISRGAKTGRCRKCCQGHPEKANWPSDEALSKMVWEQSTVQIAKQLGVSDKAVEKRCRLRKINKPPRGYWRQQTAAHKVHLPSNEELARLVWTTPIVQIAKRLGVSYYTIARHCRKNQISTPQPGYWAQQQALKKT